MKNLVKLLLIICMVLGLSVYAVNVTTSDEVVELALQLSAFKINTQTGVQIFDTSYISVKTVDNVHYVLLGVKTSLLLLAKDELMNLAKVIKDIYKTGDNIVVLIIFNTYTNKIIDVVKVK